jgi:nucleotide-binding universal stress UspA family protein
MVKDIVVNLGLGARDPAGVYAISLAEAFEAHVLGAAVSYEPVIPGVQRRESENKARAAIGRFELAAQREGLSYETRILSTSIGGAADQLGRIGRRFDLVVLGQPERNSPNDVINEAVLFESGRPVIFVPFIQKGGMTLDRIMVCWDASRAAARAVADALPFLKKAKQVDIVIVSDKPSSKDEIPGADLGQHLVRHSLEVEIKYIVSPEVDVPSTILSHAADFAADMIVMGGYGHSRLREFVLGGVTRGMLKSMTVPVLMSH